MRCVKPTFAVLTLAACVLFGCSRHKSGPTAGSSGQEATPSPAEYTAKALPDASRADRRRPARTAGEFIHFARGGNMMSSLRSAEVTILTNGNVMVSYCRRNEATNTSTFSLATDEVAKLKELVRSVGFFGQPEEQEPRFTDSSRMSLIISIGGERRKVVYWDGSPLAPLTDQLRKLIHQAVVINGIEEEGDVFSACSAVSPNLVGSKVFQPESLVDPLRAFVSSSRHGRKLEYALTALARIQLEKEWVGFVSSTLEKADAELHDIVLGLLASHPFRGNIPAGHLEALFPLFLRELNAHWKCFAQSRNRRRDALGKAMGVLGSARYKPAVPLLVKMTEELSTEERAFPLSSLPRMGYAAIDPLERLLKNPKNGVRRAAADMLGRVAFLSPNTGLRALSAVEREKALTRLRRTTVPMLEDVAANDPDKHARSCARRSLEEIEKRWREK